MGVKDLWSILTPVMTPVTLANLRGQTLAVDLSIWVVETQGVRQMQGVVTKPYLRNLFFRTNHLLQLGINLIFVIEGEAPELKWETMAQRTQVRYRGRGRGRGQAIPTHKPKRSHFRAVTNECCRMLDEMGVPYVQSAGEAEAMCALLNSQGVVDACLTDDGDVFLYGARRVYRNFTMNTKDPHVERYDMADIECHLALSRHNLVALGLLLGCDYVPKGVPGVGRETALKFFKQLGQKDALKRFDSWLNNKGHYAGLQAISSSKKVRHCNQCKHPGSARDHEKKGCSLCGSAQLCDPKPYDYVCECDWHRQQERVCAISDELGIYKKAVTTPGFPWPKVVQEFMSSNDKVPKKALRWKCPRLLPFMSFCEVKMEWERDYSREKLLPLLTLWQMRAHLGLHVRSMLPSIEPHDILKTRVRQGTPCFEVHWNKLEEDVDFTDEYYTTIEEAELISSCYPSLVESFEAAKPVKTTRKKAKARTEECDKDNINTLTSAMEDVTISDSLPLKQKDGRKSVRKLPLDKVPHAQESVETPKPYVGSIDKQKAVVLNNYNTYPCWEGDRQETSSRQQPCVSENHILQASLKENPPDDEKSQVKNTYRTVGRAGISGHSGELRPRNSEHKWSVPISPAALTSTPTSPGEDSSDEDQQEYLPLSQRLALISKKKESQLVQRHTFHKQKSSTDTSHLKEIPEFKEGQRENDGSKVNPSKTQPKSVSVFKCYEPDSSSKANPSEIHHDKSSPKAVGALPEPKYLRTHSNEKVEISVKSMILDTQDSLGIRKAGQKRDPVASSSTISDLKETLEVDDKMYVTNINDSGAEKTSTRNNNQPPLERSSEAKVVDSGNICQNNTAVTLSKPKALLKCAMDRLETSPTQRAVYTENSFELVPKDDDVFNVGQTNGSDCAKADTCQKPEQKVPKKGKRATGRTVRKTSKPWYTETLLDFSSNDEDDVILTQKENASQNINADEKQNAALKENSFNLEGGFIREEYSLSDQAKENCDNDGCSFVETAVSCVGFEGEVRNNLIHKYHGDGYVEDTSNMESRHEYHRDGYQEDTSVLESRHEYHRDDYGEDTSVLESRHEYHRDDYGEDTSVLESRHEYHRDGYQEDTSVMESRHEYHRDDYGEDTSVLESRHEYHRDSYQEDTSVLESRHEYHRDGYQEDTSVMESRHEYHRDGYQEDTSVLESRHEYHRDGYGEDTSVMESRHEYHRDGYGEDTSVLESRHEYHRDDYGEYTSVMESRPKYHRDDYVKDTSIMERKEHDDDNNSEDCLEESKDVLEMINDTYDGEYSSEGGRVLKYTKGPQPLTCIGSPVHAKLLCDTTSLDLFEESCNASEENHSVLNDNHGKVLSTIDKSTIVLDNGRIKETSNIIEPQSSYLVPGLLKQLPTLRDGKGEAVTSSPVTRKLMENQEASSGATEVTGAGLVGTPYCSPIGGVTSCHTARFQSPWSQTPSKDIATMTKNDGNITWNKSQVGNFSLGSTLLNLSCDSVKGESSTRSTSLTIPLSPFLMDRESLDSGESRSPLNYSSPVNVVTSVRTVSTLSDTTVCAAPSPVPLTQRLLSRIRPGRDRALLTQLSQPGSRMTKTHYGMSWPFRPEHKTSACRSASQRESTLDDSETDVILLD